MSFSLRSTFVAIAWIAWLLAALTLQHGLVPELFVLSQFALLAISMSLALHANVRLKLFGICFAAGFLAWFLLLIAEKWFCDVQVFRATPAGWRLWQIAMVLIDETNSGDTLGARMNTTTSVIRTSVGSLLGILTYACVSWLIHRPNAKSDAQ